MNSKVRHELARRKRRIHRRLKRARRRVDSGRPTLRQSGCSYEVARRTRALAQGGIGAVHDLVLGCGLVGDLDARVEVLRVHRPYHESDHVLNIAYNILCGGRTLDDIELRGNDEVFLDALGVEAIPDPTTAGGFCRRFKPADVRALMEAINTARLRIWRRQGPELTKATARSDADVSMVSTTGECKGGMARSYKAERGYMPLLVSLANTHEPLFIVNRSGTRPSAEGAAEYLDKAVALCRQGGFEDIMLRGDTDFSQTRHLDRWDDDGVRFVFGYDVHRGLKERADGLDSSAFPGPT